MQYIPSILLFFLPTYSVRFGFLGFSANLLMLVVVFVWIIFTAWLLYEKKVRDFYISVKGIPAQLHVSVLLFFVAGIVSLCIGGFTSQKFGQFIVLFLQPISLFCISRYIFSNSPKAKAVFRASSFMFVSLAGLFAIFQYATLIGLPVQYWGNSVEPKRALSFFDQPNMYALFVAPLLAWLLPEVLQVLKSKRWFELVQVPHLFVVFAWVSGSLGLFLSLSRGAWAALFVVVIIASLVALAKKQRLYALGIFVLCSLVVLAMPNFRYRIALPFVGEKSSVSRFSLWHNGQVLIEQSPILGKGLLGYSTNFDKVNTDPGLEHHNHPHNLLLAIWVDTGILGLASFVFILLYGLFVGFKKRKEYVVFGLGLFVVAILVQGMIDTPYMKNDLASLFWLIYAFNFSS